MLANFITVSKALPALARYTGRFLRIISGRVKTAVAWLEKRRQLRTLSDLDDDRLRDIGLSRHEVERACPTPFWVGPPGKPQQGPVRLPLHVAFLLSGVLAALGTPQALSQEICRPSLLAKASRHSNVVNFQRQWTGMFAVDASRCLTTAGSFDIEFVRLKDSGPDLTFFETFTWRPDQVEVSLDLTWDEWVNASRISEVAPCPCRN